MGGETTQEELQRLHNQSGQETTQADLKRLHERLTQETWRADRNEREVRRLLNVVCDTAGCSAPVVRNDDGSRTCMAGHSGRWVNVDLLRKVETELAAEKTRADKAEAAFAGLSKKHADDLWSAQKTDKLWQQELKRAEHAVTALADVRKQLDAATTYAVKIDAELEELKAQPARQLADAGVARATHEYDMRMKAEKEVARLKKLMDSGEWVEVAAPGAAFENVVEYNKPGPVGLTPAQRATALATVEALKQYRLQEQARQQARWPAPVATPLATPRYVAVTLNAGGSGERYGVRDHGMFRIDCATRELADTVAAALNAPVPVPFDSGAVLAALRDKGIDLRAFESYVTCGACMEVTFTGVTTNAHTCTPEVVPALTHALLRTQEQLAAAKTEAKALDDEATMLATHDLATTEQVLRASRVECAALQAKLAMLNPCELAEVEARLTDEWRDKNGLSSEPALPGCSTHGIEGCPPVFGEAAFAARLATARAAWVTQLKEKTAGWFPGIVRALNDVLAQLDKTPTPSATATSETMGGKS